MDSSKINVSETEISSSFPSNIDNIINNTANLNINDENKPIACIIVGMAGSGKTTLMQRINSYTHEKNIPSYIINLDPAVRNLPYSPNIDIRETVNYKEVMKQYNLGPNGAILTSLNLFATRFDQVLNLVEKRSPTLKNIFIDTPGQIEIFTWSASGSIITETLASSFRTVLLYVIDTPRSQSPVTFMSNMTYACSIMYKTRLPLLLVFNKTDIVSGTFAKNWMADYELFVSALHDNDTYMGSLTKSMAMALDEFYKKISAVEVSAAVGSGMDDLFDAIGAAGKQFETEYIPLLADKLKRSQEKSNASNLTDEDKEKQINSISEDRKNDKPVITSSRYNPDKFANCDYDPDIDDGFATADDYYGTEFGEHPNEDEIEQEDYDEKRDYEDFMRYINSNKTGSIK